MAKSKGVPQPVAFNSIEDLVNYEGVLPSTLTSNDSQYSTLRTSKSFEPLGKYDTGLMRETASQEYFRGEQQKGWGLLPTAVGRFIGSTVTKTLEGLSTLPTGFQENALSKEINQAERHILDEWLPVYKTEGMDSDSLGQRLREPGWWASTATDGFAFMASAIIGAKGINAISKIPKVARLAKTLGASDDILMQIDKAQRSGIGKLLALDKPGIAFATGYNAFNEAGFEARGVYDKVKDELAQQYGGEFEYLSPEQQQEISQIAGQAAQQTFWYNVPMLLLSERIFNETILGNFFGLPEASAFKRIVKEGVEVSVKPLTKAQRAGLLGLPFAANIPTESFQENYQLAVENYFSNRAKTGEMLSLLDPENIAGVFEGMRENFGTIEGQEAMFLGAFLGAVGGAAGLGGLSKSEKKAQEYADILNKGITNLNQSGTRFFQTNADGTIMKKNGVPVPKTKEQFDKDWEQVSDNFAKYQMSTTLQVLAELGDYNAQDLIDIDRANSLSELAFQFYGMEGGTELFEQIIDDYATKIKNEYGDNFKDKSVAEIASELKEESKKLESLYNLAQSYYKLDAHPESLAIQYHSLWKQDMYKRKAKEYANQVRDITSGIAGDVRTYIEDLIEKPTDSKIKGLDKQISSIDFKDVDAATTALDLQNKIAKALSYNSLYKAERKHFEKELTSEDFYTKLKEKVENETNQKASEEEKATQVAERKAKIDAEKAAKQSAQSQPPVQPTSPTAPVQPATPQATVSIPAQPAQPQTRDVQADKRLIEDYLRGRKSSLATTIGRELGLGNAKELLEELVAEGVVEKTSNGRYKLKETSQQDVQTESDTADIEAKKADIERRRQEELKQVKPISYSDNEIKRKQENQQRRVDNAKEIISFGKTFSEALDNIMKRQEELNNILNKRQKEETKDREVHQYTKEELEAQPEYQEIKRLDKLINSINDVYTEGKSENFKNSTQEALDFENQELEAIPSKRKRNSEEIGKINAKYDAELRALENQPELTKIKIEPFNSFVKDGKLYIDIPAQETFKSNDKIVDKTTGQIINERNTGERYLTESAYRNNQIKEQFTNTLKEGDEIVDKFDNTKYFFKNGTIVKADGKRAAASDVFTFIHGATIIRDQQSEPIEFTEEVEEIVDSPDLPIEIYTDKQIEEQHTEVLKAEGKFLVTSALSEGHNVLAMRVVKMEKVFEGDAVTRQNKNDFELDEDANTAYMHSAVKQGDKVTIRPVTGARDVKQYVDIRNDETVTFGEKIDNAPVENYYETVVDNIPLEIVHGDTVIGYVHTVDWINPTNLTELPEFMSLEEQRESLRAFREQFVNPDGSIKTLEVESTIEVIFDGKLAKAKTELELNQATPSFPIAIATGYNQVKTLDGKLITTSHKVSPGSAGIVVDNMFFIAKRKRLNDSQKEMLRSELESKKKDKEKIKSMVYTSEAADDTKALEAAKKQKSPNRYRLVISQYSYWVYDNQNKTLFTKNSNLDLYLNQDIVANITLNPAEYNRQWIGEMLTTNIREVKANYDGNVEPTIFVHPVIKFSMPSAPKQTQEIQESKIEEKSNTNITSEEADYLNDIDNIHLSASVNVSQQALDLIKKCK